MAFGAGFQLSVELTNLVAPLANAVVGAGSLALAEARKRSGSDIITETKLASTLGTNRIEGGIIEPHFRLKIAKSDQQPLSKWLQNLVLESGAGPTVQQCLRDPPLFSVVIQVSALAFAHELQSLSGALVTAFEDTLKAGGERIESGLDYASVLGTIRACQQQTAAFSWSSTFEWVEDKILSDLQDAYRRRQTRRSSRNAARKSQPSLVDREERPESVVNRNLPYAILRLFLMWLHTLQELPANRVLYLKCDSGISTAVVWCHFILGISTSVKIQGINVAFGDGPAIIFLEDCRPFQSEGALLDPTDESEPLFKLCKTGWDDSVDYEERANLAGFGTRLLLSHNVPKPSCHYCAHWIIGRCVEHLRRITSKDKEGNVGQLAPGQSFEEQRFLDTAATVFGLDNVDSRLVRSTIEGDTDGFVRFNFPWVNMIPVMYALHRVRNLETCTALPLSLKAFKGLTTEIHGFRRNGQFAQGLIPDNEESFALISRLLLGTSYSPDSTGRASLVSAWGWSIFFDAFDAVDPSDLTVNEIIIKAGVPSRGGVRKSWIVDGPSDSLLSTSALGDVYNEDPRIVFWHKVSESTFGPMIVGNYGIDAFSASQVFKCGASRKTTKTEWRLGFREKFRLRARFGSIAPCRCAQDITNQEVLKWIDDRTDYQVVGELPQTTRDRAAAGGEKDDGSSSMVTFQGKLPRDLSDISKLQERVFFRSDAFNAPPGSVPASIWFFFVSSDPAARWMALDDLVRMSMEREFSYLIRDRGCCVECACKQQVVNSITTLVLL